MKQVDPKKHVKVIILANAKLIRDIPVGNFDQIYSTERERDLMELESSNEWNYKFGIEVKGRVCGIRLSS